MLRADIKRRIAVDLRGKISCGTKNARGYPTPLEYFNISAFPELEKVYGNKPDKLLVFFPSNNIEDFFSTEYSKYGTSSSGNSIKKRVCDGITCIHRIQEVVNGITYEAGEETPCICKSLPDDHPDRCDVFTYLKAWIGDPSTGIIISPTPYMIINHSVNSADNIYSVLYDTWQITGGRLVGVPFVLSVELVKSSIVGKDKKQVTSKFPIWKLQPMGTMEQIIKLATQACLPTSPQNALQLEAPKDIPADGNTDTIGAKGWAELCQLANSTIKDQKGRIFSSIHLSKAIEKYYGIKNGANLTTEQAQTIKKEWFGAWKRGEWDTYKTTIK